MARSVGISEDFKRICALPMRELTEEQAERDNAALTPLLTTPLGRKEGAHLVNKQGTALRELCEVGGAYCGLPVGDGKTLIFYLAPYVLEAERPLLIIPSGLREKTWNEFAGYERHWLRGKPMRIMGFNEFTQDENLDLFEQLKPDFVGIDEADKLSNQEGSVTVRLARWKTKSGCKVLTGTGTGTRFSTQQFSHFLVWCLEEGAPWPLDPFESDTWAAALDEKPAKFARGPRGQRTRVGVLVDLARIERVPDMTDRDIARAAFQKRLCSTPGVIISDSDSCDQPLSIELRCAPEDEELNERFDFFRNEEETPDGWELLETLDRYAHEEQLGQGLYFKIHPRPPLEYIEARRAVARFISTKIGGTRHYALPECERCGTIAKRASGVCKQCGFKVSRRVPFDTPEAVKKAFRDHPIIVEWYDVQEPSFKIQSVPTWLSASVVHAAAKYARENVCLVWTKFEAVGEAIAKAAGLKYYGAGGLSADGGAIDRQTGERSAVLSIAANLRGRNLQMFNDNYVVGAPASARDREQLYGRTHRQKQKKPVRFVELVTSGLSRYSFDMARKEAHFVKQTQGQTQKLLRAEFKDCVFPSDALRWRRKYAA